MSFAKVLDSFLEKYLMPIAGAVSEQRHLKAMRDGLIYSIPFTIFGGLILIIGTPPVPKTVMPTNFILNMLVSWREWAATSGSVVMLLYNMTMGFLALYVAIGVAHSLAKSYKMDTQAASLISVATFLVISAPYNFKDGTISVKYLDAKGLFTAIIIGLLTVEITRFLKERNIGIKMPAGVPPAVTSSFDALIPLIVNVVIFYFISLLIQNSFGMIIPQAIISILQPAISAVDTAPAIFIVGVLTQLFWFAGLHGGAIVKSMFNPFLTQNIAMNSEALIAGQQLPYVFTDPFWFSFMAIGGGGSTLALILLYMRSKSKQLKALGRVGLIPGLFNISEPIIFGSPIVLNPVLFIPFVFIGGINGVIAYYLTRSGLIKAASILTPWTTPAPLNALISTMDWRAMIASFAILFLDILIYYPFFKTYEKQLVKSEEENAEETQPE